LRLYSPPSGFLSRRWGQLPPHPRFPLRSACLADGSLPLISRGQRNAWQVGAAAPTLRFPLRSACLADGSLPRATKRLAGGGGPHNPAFRCARLVLKGGSLPRAANRLPCCACTCALVRLLAAEVRNDKTFVAFIAAAALEIYFIVVGGNPPSDPPLRCARLHLRWTRCRGQRTRPWRSRQISRVGLRTRLQL
jgi:hypothetical protein